MRIALLLGILSLASAGGADDQRTHSQPRSPSLRLPAPDHAKDPFARVFPAPQIVTPGVTGAPPRPAVRARDVPERVVCGTRLIPTDPNLDRGMVHTPDPRAGVEFAIKRVHPTSCVDPK